VNKPIDRFDPLAPVRGADLSVKANIASGKKQIEIWNIKGGVNW
jgi:hypothetical protein